MDKIDPSLSEAEPSRATLGGRWTEQHLSRVLHSWRNQSVLGIVVGELLRSVPTADQHLQGRLRYLPVSSMDAAEITGVKLWDLITRSGGGSKLLGHIYILTPRATSGRRRHWDKNRGNFTRAKVETWRFRLL